MLVVICIVLRITNLQRRIDFEQQISNLKLRFFTDISHELRTPLTLIASPIDEVISNEKLSDAGMENMQVAKRTQTECCGSSIKYWIFARYRMTR